MDTKDLSDADTRQKHAACLECRKSKIKCIRSEEGSVCRKCAASGATCVVPAYHVGRYKGVKNKRTGLEKAISQVEKAIKKSKTGASEFDAQQALALEQLLQHTGGIDGLQRSMSSPSTENTNNDTSTAAQFPQTSQRPSITHGVSYATQSDDPGELTVNNADNPLQLLAIASAIPDPSPSVRTIATSNNNGEAVNAETIQSATQRFFRPLTAKLDVSPKLDPIDLGLATEVEAQSLFEFFHASLAHTRWGLDSRIHSWSFVRSRSAFLLTSVMAASALFLPHTAALSMRLRNHVKHLIAVIVAERYRSVEIVLGLMINIPWMIPGNEWAAEDDTCYYISTALSIALDLSMNRIIIPSTVIRPTGLLDRTSKANCIDASKALNIDQLGEVEISSELGKRLLRTRERVWLALFNLDRGVCLARGRPSIVPASALVDFCDTWHISDIAEEQDGALVSSTVLRRDFAALVGSVRSTCDNNPLTVGNGSATVRGVRDRIERFFDQWHDSWKLQIQQGDGKIPPYVEILASHTKLSAYCSVINHPTAPPDVKKFFRTAGLASALNVLKTAVLAESRLRSMPNNTVIMASFAAFFVLGLSNNKTGGDTLMAPNTRGLIEEMADVLQRLGSTPSHRQGASIWFGRHIKAISMQSSTILPSPRGHRKRKSENAHTVRRKEDLSTTTGVAEQEISSSYLDYGRYDDFAASANIQDFPVLDMTNDQIIDAIVNSKDDIEALSADFLYDERQFPDWFDFIS